MSKHATEAMLDNIKQRLIENMADFLDDESTKLDEAIALIKDPVTYDESELHIRMANAAFEEYKNTMLPSPPDELDKEAKYDWEKAFYRRMEINGYKRAEYIPEISDSVELFREFIQLGYFTTPPSNKR